MQRETEEFEELLRTLKPMPPSAEVKERIRAELAGRRVGESAPSAGDVVESAADGDRGRELGPHGLGLLEERGELAGRRPALQARRGSRRKAVWGVACAAAAAMAAVWATLVVLDDRLESPQVADERGGEKQAGALSEGSGEEASFAVNAHPIDQYATLVEAVPSRIYYTEDGVPVQRLALRYLDTEVWELEGVEGTIAVSSYRDELRVIPAPMF